MKSKIYSIALMALISMGAWKASNAQGVAPAAPAPPAATVTAPASAYAVGTYSNQSYAVAPAYSFSYGGNSQDTTGREKARKIQEQIRALNKELNDLNRETMRKNMAEMQTRMATMRKVQSIRMDSSFSRRFARSATNMRFNFDNDSNLLKQVQSGEVKEKVKSFSKSYAVDANDKLQIDNTYGKITINTWPKNEVKVDVDIKAYSTDDSEAQKLIDNTTINTSKENNLVSFTTDIHRDENSWWGTSSDNGHITKVRKVVINYVVYMPAKSALTISNKYGGIILPDLSGKLSITNKYGSLMAKALTNTENMIDLKYGDAIITSLNGSDINLAYGSLNLESADNLTRRISYSPVKIGRLSSSGNITMKYGDGLVIGDVGKNLKTLTVNSSYAPIKLGSLNDTNADFDVTVHYGDFVYGGTTNVTSKTPDNERGYTSTKNYKGHVGKGNTEKVITIKSTYSSVNFD